MSIISNHFLGRWKDTQLTRAYINQNSAFASQAVAKRPRICSSLSCAQGNEAESRRRGHMAWWAGPAVHIPVFLVPTSFLTLSGRSRCRSEVRLLGLGIRWHLPRGMASLFWGSDPGLRRCFAVPGRESGRMGTAEALGEPREEGGGVGAGRSPWDRPAQPAHALQHRDDGPPALDRFGRPPRSPTLPYRYPFCKSGDEVGGVQSP